MTAAVWEQVHVGDVVRGADQRGWTVVGRGPVRRWLIGAHDARFVLRREQREAVTFRSLTEPVDLITRADHTNEQAAVSALAGAGFAIEILEETLTSTDPFTAPAAAQTIKRDRFGRYLLPDPETGVEKAWTRATTIARTLADEYNLTLWKLRMVARGMGLRPDLVAGAAAADPDADRKTLDEIASKAMERAGGSTGATLGTALHSFTHRLDRGEALSSLGAPAPLDADLVEYGRALARHRLTVVPEWSERIIVVPELGVAGQFDNLVRQPAGVTKSRPVAVLDKKTAKSIEYSMLEIAIQLAIYAHAPLLWNPQTASYEPMPADVDQERALVLHMPVGKAHAQIYGVNLIEGWEYAQLAMKVREARSRGKGMAWLVDPEPADLAIHRVRKAADQAELARLWDQLQPRGLWTEEVNAAAASRWEEINSTALTTATA